MADNVTINVQQDNDIVNIVSSQVTEVVDVNVYETTEEVTLNITEEIVQVNINKVTNSGTTQNLQDVTDIGNRTTNDIFVEDANYYSVVQPSDIGTENKTTGAYTFIGANGEVGIFNGIAEANFKNTNLTNNLVLEVPNKSGTKTIATTDDIPTVNDATSSVKGILKLTNDLGGTADLPTVPALANKVDKVTGKGLSTNDYTTAEQIKLSGIQAGATANDTDANLKNRANHTGTQLAATISDFATAVGLLITNKVDKVTGYSLTKNDLTDALKTAYDNAVSSLTTLLATGQRLITSAEITKLSNTSGINTGDQDLSALVPYTGASTDVDLNTKNLKVNNIFEGFTSVAASATLITLTVNSTPSYLVTGSGGQTIKLPNATTLQNGAIYDFNNNQSSGAISVNNNSNTLVKSIPSGGYLVLTLIDNSTAAGSWDAHFQAPSNVSWSTNTFDYVGSITGATWNGVNIADNRIASSATWNAKQNASSRRNANNSSNNNINYCGVALGTGVSDSSAVWTITRLTIGASGSITTATATNVSWTNRQSATYI